ncbi:tetratricopeptide repeat protein [Methanobrevibacter filiformis]|uniref:Tetratricopeptide repeat protein n=1 Tax=Methanobrevibacter filiformis TaxID=55758 RepID=A0A166A3B8_9EURY|nr:hypothetical protein [Methanobrevibacter filiformis]KZX11511.1 tetratricopeptide repeat protein [Methanobrevibacter filiformis]
MFNFINKNKAKHELKRGIIHFNNGDIKKALNFFTRSSETFPKHEKAFIFQAIAYLHLNDYLNALNSYGIARSIDFNCVEGWIGEGNCLVYFEKYDDAIKLFDEALKFNKNNLELILAKAGVFEFCGNFEEELYCANYILEQGIGEEEGTHLKASIFYLQEKFNLALEWYYKLLELNKYDDKYWYEIAFVFFELDNIDDALIAMEKAVNLSGRFNTSYLQAYSNLLDEKEEWDKALDVINESMELRNDFSLYYYKGLYLSKLNRIKESEKICEKGLQLAFKLIEINPSVELYQFIGLFLDLLGKTDNAAEYYSKAELLKSNLSR